MIHGTVALLQYAQGAVAVSGMEGKHMQHLLVGTACGTAPLAASLSIDGRLLVPSKVIDQKSD